VHVSHLLQLFEDSQHSAIGKSIKTDIVSFETREIDWKDVAKYRSPRLGPDVQRAALRR